MVKENFVDTYSKMNKENMVQYINQILILNI